MARLIEPDDEAALRKAFAHVRETVTIRLYSGEEDADLRQLMDELVTTADRKIVLEHLGAGDTAGLPIPSTPVMALTSPACKGKVFLYGLPIGYEMSTLVGAIVELGRSGEADLLAKLEKDTQLSVFSTSTDPHSPRMALLAVRLAKMSARVTTLSIEAESFPEAATHAQVRAVPHTVINGVQALIGAVPEAVLVQAILDQGQGESIVTPAGTRGTPVR